jgi:hypothetical protein
MISRKLYDQSFYETFGRGIISPYLVSACCNADVIDCAGCYCPKGIMWGYECIKCGKYLYRTKDFNEKIK